MYRRLNQNITNELIAHWQYTEAVIEAKKLKASDFALKWIEKRLNEGNSGLKDACAATELLAMLCCDKNVESCRGLKAINGDYGLKILLEIIITGNSCANVAARALSNTLATSDGPESALRIMESGGLSKVCQYLKTCKLGETEPLVIAETLKVVKRCCERFRPDAQVLSIEEGIFTYLIDWVLSLIHI